MPSITLPFSYSCVCSTSTLYQSHSIPKINFPKSILNSNWLIPNSLKFPSAKSKKIFSEINCCSDNQTKNLRTCKNCKTQFDPILNHPLACRFHTAHFGGETKRKFESVYTGGTMSTPNSGQVLQYWHCCGSEDSFDPGCTSAPHSSYDD